MHRMWLAPAIQNLVEDRSAARIKTNELAIQYGIFHAQLRECRLEIVEASVRQIPAGN